MSLSSVCRHLARWLPWVQEHQRITRDTQLALEDARAARERVALSLNALRLAIRRRQSP